MAFKPGRGEEGDIDLKQLRAILNQTKQSIQNNPLYQFCNSLLDILNKYLREFNRRLKALESLEPGGDTPTPSADALDYVVMSDGALPTPSPVDDGFGNFIYIPYEP